MCPAMRLVAIAQEMKVTEIAAIRRKCCKQAAYSPSGIIN